MLVREREIMYVCIRVVKEFVCVCVCEREKEREKRGIGTVTQIANSISYRYPIRLYMPLKPSVGITHSFRQEPVQH